MKGSVCLVLGISLSLFISSSAIAADTKYWDKDCAEHDVDIDGHDFDFDANPNPDSGWDQSGTADGPFSHNGEYDVKGNSDGGMTMDFEMTCDDHNTDVTINIDGSGNVSVTDNSGGGTALPSDPQVSGSGTSSDPYSVTWTDANGESTTFSWSSTCKKKKARCEGFLIGEPLFH